MGKKYLSFYLTTTLTIFAPSSASPSPFRVAKASLALQRKEGYKKIEEDGEKEVFL